MYGTVKAEMVCTQVRSSSYVFLTYGDNVKIYMQMMDLELMDLESYKKVKKIFKKLDLQAFTKLYLEPIVRNHL